MSLMALFGAVTYFALSRNGDKGGPWSNNLKLTFRYYGNSKKEKKSLRHINESRLRQVS